MPTYQRQTTVVAPLEDVFDFHSHVSGLVAVTPAWLGMRVESVVGPDGGPDPDVLEAGSEVTLSVRPFGVGPRQRWTAAIVDRELEDGAAYLRDEMVRGPFERWEHTHSFVADGDATVVRDRLEYDLPTPLGDIVGPIARVGLEPMFRARHRTTRALLEDDRWERS
ncbi:SRPBCC family protein [Natrialbaceae archaeon GCM10025810]|uniref:SRPBCC family protein n=1 Tax=Halovalidus salilacus TaxID=3075124 RepID=UPI0036082C66